MVTEMKKDTLNDISAFEKVGGETRVNKNISKDIQKS